MVTNYCAGGRKEGKKAKVHILAFLPFFLFKAVLIQENLKNQKPFFEWCFCNYSKKDNI